MVERRGGLRLLPEARDECRIAAVLGAQHLDRDVAAELRVVGAVDRGHATLAEQLDEAIAAAEYLSYLGQGLVVPLQIRGQPREGSAQVEPGQVASELGADVGSFERQLDRALSQPIVVPAS